jgi:VanZ family protein
MRLPVSLPPLTLPTPRWWSTVLPLILYCLVIFYFSSQTRFFIQPPDFFSSDKVYHFLEYAVLGILAGRVIRAHTLDVRVLSPVGAVTLFCLIYGAGDEFHQWFVPGRSATVGDVLADTFGGWAGGRLYFIFFGIHSLRRRGSYD